MNTEFARIYNQSRNGANTLTRHPLVRKFVMSDGVIDCAECGMWWLVDIAATEIPAIMKRHSETLGIFTARVKEGHAVLNLTGAGDVEIWKRVIDWTDMPDGEWVFYVGDDGDHYTMILPSEY